MDHNDSMQSPMVVEHQGSTSPAQMTSSQMSNPDEVNNQEKGMSMHNDPEMRKLDPQLFNLAKKLHVTAASWFAVFTLVYAATVATPVIPVIPEVLKTSVTMAHLVFTAPFIGVFMAPIYTPHITEIAGRRPVYIVSMSLFLIFIGGISQATSVNQLIILRVFAGFVGGPMAVLIEGSHADVWPAIKTVSYYCSIALSQYWGAAFGAIVGTQALLFGGAPWTAYSALIIGAFAWILVVTMPETYQRQLIRRARKHNPSLELEPAPTGTTLPAMLHLTLWVPLKMWVTEPLVIMGGLLLGLSFAVVFQWFITVPFVLSKVYKLDAYAIGMVFFAAAAGSAMAFGSSILIDSQGFKMRNANGHPKIEQRLFSAMLGVLLTTGSLFWVAWTAKPTIHYMIPVTGTAFYVWGNMSILLSIVSYFFDAYRPQAILSALTAMACFRLACAAIVPIFVLDMFAGLTPPWALSTFGFIHMAFIPFPFIMYVFGERLRAKSLYATMGHGMSAVMMEFEGHVF